MTHGRGYVRFSLMLLLLPGLIACGARKPAPGTPAAASPEQVRLQAEQAARFGDHARALAAWQKVLDVSPDDMPALLGVGEVYLAAGEHAAALAVFDRVLALAPDMLDGREGRGLALTSLGRSVEARVQLQDVIRMAPNRWRALNAMGLLLDMEGRRDEAHQHYTKALALQPGNPLILNNLGYSRLMAHDYAMAERLFREGLQSAPDESFLHANLVLAIAWQGDYARAVAEAVQVQAREEALNNVGYIALLRKDYPAAISHFERAMEASPRWYARAAANLERARQEVASSTVR